MSLADDVCDWCGRTVDPMNDDAVARVVRNVWCLWCSAEHAVAWGNHDLLVKARDTAH